MPVLFADSFGIVSTVPLSGTPPTYKAAGVGNWTPFTGDTTGIMRRNVSGLLLDVARIIDIGYGPPQAGGTVTTTTQLGTGTLVYELQFYGVLQFTYLNIGVGWVQVAMNATAISLESRGTTGFSSGIQNYTLPSAVTLATLTTIRIEVTTTGVKLFVNGTQRASTTSPYSSSAVVSLGGFAFGPVGYVVDGLYYLNLPPNTVGPLIGTPLVLKYVNCQYGTVSGALGSPDAVTDTLAPTFNGDTITVLPQSPTKALVGWPTASDNVGVIDYETRLNGGAWGSRGLTLSQALTGLTADTVYTYEARAEDAAGLFSPVLLKTFRTPKVEVMGALEATLEPGGLKSAQRVRWTGPVPEINKQVDFFCSANDGAWNMVYRTALYPPLDGSPPPASFPATFPGWETLSLLLLNWPWGAVTVQVRPLITWGGSMADAYYGTPTSVTLYIGLPNPLAPPSETNVPPPGWPSFWRELRSARVTL